MSKTTTGKHRIGMTALLGAATVLALTGCADNDPDDPVELPHPEVSYQAKIERTQGGVPHITASDFGSLGFGTGYAAAGDNFCILARNILQYRGQLAEYLGADASEVGDNENLETDWFYLMMVERGYYDHEVDPELETMFAGFAAGYNRYLKDTGIANIPDPECRGADWVLQMTTEDVRRFHLKPVFLPNLSSLILPAAPPVVATAENKVKAGEKSTTELLAQQPQTEAPARPLTDSKQLWNEQEQLEIAALVDHLTNPFDKGSNGVAIGRDLATNGKGVLYTNPHLDWSNDFRMYPRHHIIPGVLNELGANTFERANVGFGTNGHIAWTNTVSTSTALVFRQLKMVDGDPMSYVFDGEVKRLEALPITAKVKNTDGTLVDATHTFFLSQYGFMAKLSDLLGWGTTIQLAEEGPRGMQGGSIGIARATTVRELKDSLNKSQHTSSTNTIAVDTNGEAFYGDLGPVSNFTDEQYKKTVADGGCDLFGSGDIYNGDSSSCDWGTDPDSAAPGLLGASKQAYLFRTDYVTNSNDNYWLANPNEPLTGIPLVQGDRVGNERTLRTRSGLKMVQQRIDGGDGLGGNTFDLDSLHQRMLSNENYAGLILKADLVTLCQANPSVTVPAELPEDDDVERTVDISAACTPLANWDAHSNLESTGAHLFREFMRSAHLVTDKRDNSRDRSRTRRLPAGLNYTAPFNINDPVNTPSGLNTGDNPLALQALALAVEKLTGAGMALDARLGDIQSVSKGSEVIPMHGGEEFEGVFNKMAFDLDEAAGRYPEMTGSGASWVMVTEFTDAGPVSRGNLAYSVSSSAESPHYSDMTRLFSNKQFVDLPYHPEDVTAAAISTVEVSEGADSCLDGGWESFTGEEFANEAECVDFFRQVNADRVTEYVTTGYEKPAQ